MTRALDDRHGVLAHVQAHAVDHVVRGQVLAVVEGDALLELEGELGGVRVHFPGLRELGAQGQVVVELDQAVVVGAPTGVAQGLLPEQRIERVVGAVLRRRHADHAAALGRGRLHVARAGDDRGRAGGAEAGREEALHEVAPAQAPGLEHLPDAFDLGHLVVRFPLEEISHRFAPVR